MCIWTEPANFQSRPVLSIGFIAFCIASRSPVNGRGLWDRLASFIQRRSVACIPTKGIGVDLLWPDIWLMSNGSCISQHQFSAPGRHVLYRPDRTVLREMQRRAPILKVVSLDAIFSRAPEIADPDELWPLGSWDSSNVGLLGSDGRFASGFAVDVADLLIGSERVGSNKYARI